MVNSWGFEFLPKGIIDLIARFKLLIGYPFGGATPVPPKPKTVTIEQIDYFRSYLGSPKLVLVAPLISWTPKTLVVDTEINYFRGYLGRT